MDERNKRIIMEACTILDNFSIDDSSTYKAEAVLRGVASIIRLAAGLQVGGVQQ